MDRIFGQLGHQRIHHCTLVSELMGIELILKHIRENLRRKSTSSRNKIENLLRDSSIANDFKYIKTINKQR